VDVVRVDSAGFDEFFDLGDDDSPSGGGRPQSIHRYGGAIARFCTAHPARRHGPQASQVQLISSIPLSAARLLPTIAATMRGKTGSNRSSGA